MKRRFVRGNRGTGGRYQIAANSAEHVIAAKRRIYKERHEEEEQEEEEEKEDDDVPMYHL